jgi:hypothetical protein
VQSDVSIGQHIKTTDHVHMPPQNAASNASAHNLSTTTRGSDRIYPFPCHYVEQSPLVCVQCARMHPMERFQL